MRRASSDGAAGVPALLAATVAAGALCGPLLSSVALAAERQVEAAATQGAEQEGAPSLGAVVREMPRDLWRFVSLDTATVLAIGGGAAFVAHGWDDDLVSTIEVSPRLNSALEPGSKYGSFAVVLGGRSLYTALGAWPGMDAWRSSAPIWSAHRW